jgi:HAD superfamily hydrolase (TIGR01509 family)
MTTRAWDQRDELVPSAGWLNRIWRRPNRAGLQAVLWDMDGLLVDTEPLWTVAEEQLAGRLGGTWDQELKARIVGTRLETAVPTILRWYGVDPTPAAVADSTAWLLARMVALFADEVQLMPGVQSLLAALTEAGIPMALVSSSYRALVDAVLQHGLGPFATSVAGDEVQHGKPHPEPYLLACKRLRVDPRHCVVLEDSVAGAQSGLAAGCAVVGVPSVDGIVIPSTDRQVVVRSLELLTVDSLRQLVAR